jgi:hypothetical protein
MSLGAEVSFSPPFGGTILAQPEIKSERHKAEKSLVRLLIYISK